MRGAAAGGRIDPPSHPGAPMRRFVLTYGLIAGAILSVLMIISLSFHDRIGFDRALIVGYTTMVIAFIMIFFGVKAYRDSVAPDGLTFGRAFMVGLLITLIATACYVATWQLVQDRLAPDYMDKYATYTLDKARQSGASAAEIAEKAKEMAEFREMYEKRWRASRSPFSSRCRSGSCSPWWPPA